MPFDLTTAQPVKQSGGFDLGSAKKSRNPKVVATEKRAAFQKDQANAQINAAHDENERSLGGVIHGTIEGLKELNPIDAAGDYLKDYGKGMATALEDAEGTTPFDAVMGGVAPIVEYPIAAAYGAGDAILRSGDYGASREKAFEAMNKTLPEGARKAQGAIGSILKPVGDLVHTAGEGLGELAGLVPDDPGTAESVRKNVSAVSEDVLGLVGGKRVAPEGLPVVKPGKAARAPVTPGVTADPLARARDAGYTLPASARNAAGKPASRVGSVAEGVAGRTTNQVRVDQLNDQRVLKGIRKDLGVPENAALTEPVFKAIMDETGKVYDAVSKALPTLKRTPGLDEAISGIGSKRRNNPLLKETPSVAKMRTRLANAGDVGTQDVLNAIEEYRADARLLAEKAEKPEMVQRAKASREAADVLEKALDDALTQQGRPDVIPSLKNARQKRAKAHQAQEAVNGKKRPGVALMDMKQGGEKLSGEMELAADVHRDMLPNGPLSVNKASAIGNEPGAIVEALQGVARPFIQPVLNSEFGQTRMFGPRQPETLAPYDPRQFEVPAPPTAMPREQGALLGPGVDLEPGAGRAGGQMPSDARRLSSTISEQLESQGPNADMFAPEGNVGGPRLGPEDPLADFRGTGPNAGPPLTPTEALDLELTPQALDRRSADVPYTGIDRRVNGLPDLSAERQRVLDRPIGTRPNAGVADALLEDLGFRQAVQGDTLANRAALNPAEQIGNGIMSPAGEISFSLEDLKALGFSDEDIAQILATGR